MVVSSRLAPEAARPDPSAARGVRGTRTRPLVTSPYPRQASRALLMAAKLRLPRWDRALEAVEQTQMAQLQRLVRHAARTEFGHLHGFRGIRTYRDWVGRVPIGDYDSFFPAIDRMMQGERNILVPEPVRYFGNSSGSSNKGKQKFLPITERQVRFQRAMSADALFRYLSFAEDDDFLTGFTLGLLPPTVMEERGPVYVTNNPALMFSKIPAFTKPVYLPHGEARVEKDYDRKLTMIAEAYLDHDVRTITGTTCWFSLLFDKLLEVARRRGRNVDTVSELWPNLDFLIGGGVAADPYLPVIRERIGRDDVVLVDTYNATEGGLYAVSDHAGEPGMLMIPDRGVFFEFVPVEDLGKPNPARVPLWGVEKHRNYAIVVTTCSGLYAYKLGDIVRFPSTDPLRMEFAGRLAGCLSTTQELTTHVEIQAAVGRALERFGAETVDYAAGADVGVEGTAKSRYLLFAEFVRPPRDLDGFIRAFDEGLCAENRVYREHRSKDAAILAPELHVLPRGSVERFMRASGRTSVQTKFPRIVDDEGRDLLRTMTRERGGAPAPSV